MASAPSASALSAVLRCRGNLWARNPPTKRPASAGYSLGLAPGARRDTHQPSAWAVGERVPVGGRLTVTRASPATDGRVSRGKDFSETNNSCCPQQYPGEARSFAPGVRSALVRSLTRKLKSNLPAIDKCSGMIRTIGCETYAAHLCHLIPGRDSREVPVGPLKVSITSTCFLESRTGQLSLVLRKCPSRPLSAVLSRCMYVRLLVMRRSEEAPLGPQEDRGLEGDLQGRGQILSQTALTSSEDSHGQRVTEDTPD